MISIHVIQRTKRFEGNVPHMYLDTEGNVTVGVGKLLAGADSATLLPFVHRLDGKPATAEEKRLEWTTIHRLKKARNPSYYAPHTTLLLPQPDIDAILTKGLRSSQGELLGIFTDYFTYPEAVREALLDMMFNLGGPKFRKFVELIKAAKQKKWSVCARESHRIGIPEERNTVIRRLFESASL